MADFTEISNGALLDCGHIHYNLARDGCFCFALERSDWATELEGIRHLIMQHGMMGDSIGLGKKDLSVVEDNFLI